MPKKKRAAKSVKRKTRKRSRPLSGLGFAPEQHKKRHEDYETDARRFLRDVDQEIDAGRCDIAFSRLIDGVSYAGMAEAEAQGASQDSAAIQALASSVIKNFRKSCKIGG